MHHVAFVVGPNDLLPPTNPVGLTLAESNKALFVLDSLDEAFNFKTNLDLVRILELVKGDMPLGLVLDVDNNDALSVNADDLALDNLVGCEISNLVVQCRVQVHTAHRLSDESIEFFWIESEFLDELFAVHGKGKKECNEKLY